MGNSNPELAFTAFVDRSADRFASRDGLVSERTQRVSQCVGVAACLGAVRG